MYPKWYLFPHDIPMIFRFLLYKSYINQKKRWNLRGRYLTKETQKSHGKWPWSSWLFSCLFSWQHLLFSWWYNLFCVLRRRKTRPTPLRSWSHWSPWRWKDLAAAWRQKGWDRRRKQRWAGQRAKELQGKDGKSIVKCEDLHECFVFLSSEVFSFLAVNNTVMLKLVFIYPFWWLR